MIDKKDYPTTTLVCGLVLILIFTWVMTKEIFQHNEKMLELNLQLEQITAYTIPIPAIPDTTEQQRSRARW